MRTLCMAGLILLTIYSVDSNHVASANSDLINTASQSLSVGDVSVNTSTGAFSFTVKNSSVKPVLGFTLLITYTYSDGAKSTVPFRVDYTTTLPIVGKVISAPVDTQIGPVQPQRSVSFHLAIGSATVHGPIRDASLLPVVAIFDDNSIAGDAIRAKTDFFQPHQAMASEYQDYVRDLKQIVSAPRLKTELETIQRKYSEASSGLDLLRGDKQMDATVLRSNYRRIAWDLGALIERLNRRTRPAAEILSSYIAEAEAMQAAYSRHCTQVVLPEGR